LRSRDRRGNTFHVGRGVSKTEAFDRLWHFLVVQHNAFYAYIFAFTMLWVVWRQHHVLLDQVSRLSSAMVGWHFALLLLAAFWSLTFLAGSLVGLVRRRMVKSAE
jgi:uncharacterized membrane protein